MLIVDVAGSSQLRAERGDAAAGRQIGFLLGSVIAAARERGASVVKINGDDVLAVFEGEDRVAAVAETALLAQQFAARTGLQVYAGFHVGPVEFRVIDGRDDVFGQTVNCAARLHKLIEDAPGRIFLVEEVVAQLPQLLRAQAAPFGMRTLKGIGSFSVWTLDWQPSFARTATVFAPERTTGGAVAALHLHHAGRTLDLQPAGRRYSVGRAESCDLVVSDPERRVSSAHLSFECVDGHWLLQDISRNGTWLLDARAGPETLLPYCQKALMPIRGSLSLGRPSSNDERGQFRVDFTIDDAGREATRS